VFKPIPSYSCHNMSLTQTMAAEQFEQASHPPGLLTPSACSVGSDESIGGRFLGPVRGGGSGGGFVRGRVRGEL